MLKKKCIVNGIEFPMDQVELNLDDLVDRFIKDKNVKVAVAVNSKLVVKSDWKKKIISSGDIIEIVQPFFGG